MDYSIIIRAIQEVIGQAVVEVIGQRSQVN